MAYTKKIKAGLVPVSTEEFIGDAGTIFYDPSVGDLHLSDGVTPGGTLLNSGGGSGNGYAGSQGTNGYTGSTGYVGSAGATGASGTQGTTGYTGSAGADGTTGATGPAGSAGYTGSAGSAGANGDIGATGLVGYTGSTGTNGSNGVTGYTGSIGESGNASIGNWAFRNDTIYNMAGGEINNGDTTHGATAGLILPENGDAGAISALFNTYGSAQIQVANIVNSATTSVWTFGTNGTLTFPNGNLKITGSTISNYIANDMGAIGSQLEVSQSKTVITNGVTNTLGGGPSLIGQSLFEVGPNVILSSFQVINTLDDTSLTSEYLTELSNNSFKIGQRVTNDLGGNSQPLVGFSGWAFSTNGSMSSMTFPNQYVNTRTYNADALVFTKTGAQKAISTQAGNSDSNTVERLVVAGGDSYQNPDTNAWVGEGGDIYLWAGQGGNGGDLKLDAGNSLGLNGEIGGWVKMRGGDSANGNGGYLELAGGDGNVNGGDVTLLGGTGTTGVDGKVRIGTNVTYNGSNTPVPANVWDFGADGITTLPGAVKSQSFAQLGQIITCMGLSNIPSQYFLFNTVTFTGGVYSDIQVGWTVSNGEGWTATVTAIDDPAPGYITIDDNWNTVSDKLISFTSADYQVATAEDLILTSNNSSLTLSSNGNLTLPNSGGVIKSTASSTIINGAYKSFTFSTGAYGVGPGYAGTAVTLTVTPESQQIQVGWTCTFSNSATVFNVMFVGYFAGDITVGIDGISDNLVFPMIANSPTSSIKLQPVNGGSTWTFSGDGTTTLPAGFVTSNEVTGINLRSGYDVSIISNHMGVDREWIFGSDGTLSYPGGSWTKTTNNSFSSGVASQVVWTSTQDFISGAKLTIQVEANEPGGLVGWDTQMCEAIVAVRGHNTTSIPVISVYGVTHTSTAPLMTFTVDRNPTTSLIEITGTRTQTATAAGGASLRIYSVETGTND